jgi:hypothetical protein
MQLTTYTVDTDKIEAMRAAFYRVCDVLRLDGYTDDLMTEVIAIKIMELAKGDILDPERLCISVLAELEPSPVGDQTVKSLTRQLLGDQDG